ncbi:MAG: Ig-like domain-containing protein [Candidatus Dormibacteraceae bacterium]
MNLPRRGRDLELDAIFEDPEALDFAQHLHELGPRAGAPGPQADPAFRSSLRRDLMRQAWSIKEPALPWWRRLTGPVGLSWAAATVGIALLAFVAYDFHQAPPADRTIATVSSPLNHVQAAGLERAIPLVFNQPMDHSSVESAIRVEPATKVTYQWSGKTLYVHPEAGALAPNTQYQVKVGPSARTASGKAVQKVKTISFVTAPAPSLVPIPTPSTPAGPALGASREIAHVAATDSAWAPYATTLYVAGAQGVEAIGAGAAGPPTVLASTPADRLALSPDSSQVLFSGSGGVGVVPAAGGRPATMLSRSPAVALGWQGAKPVFVQDAAVYRLELAVPSLAGAAPAPVRLATLTASATAAAFSPDGTQLLYTAGATTRLLDLGHGQASAWPQAGSAFAWAPDGKKVAYVTAATIMSAGADGSAPVRMAGIGASAAAGRVATSNGTGQGVALAWSSLGQVMIGTDAGLWLASPDGSAVDKLGDGAFAAASWAPDGSGIAYSSAGALTLAEVLPAGSVRLTQGDQLVSGFMAARLAGDVTAANGYLDPKARAAGAAKLPPSRGAAVVRDFVLLAQRRPGSLRYVVRILLARGGVETSQYDETLTLVPDTSGRLLVDQVVDGPQGPVGPGPSVVAIKVFREQIQVTFDSDLDGSTVQGAISLVDATGQPLQQAVNYAGRTVSLQVPPLTPGAAYRLVVSANLSDIDGREPSATYDLNLLGPSEVTLPAAPATAPPSPPAGANQPGPAASPTPLPSP